jgi:hypothetical protein
VNPEGRCIMVVLTLGVVPELRNHLAYTVVLLGGVRVAVCLGSFNPLLSRSVS